MSKARRLRKSRAGERAQVVLPDEVSEYTVDPDSKPSWMTMTSQQVIKGIRDYADRLRMMGTSPFPSEKNPYVIEPWMQRIMEKHPDLDESRIWQRWLDEGVAVRVEIRP